MLKPYRGKIPSNVNRDAKYSVKYDSEGKLVVHLIYRLGPYERALLTNGTHGQLVEMVNAVKEEAQGRPGGAFYINEFGHVIVPVQGGAYYYAGRYDDALVEFDFDDDVLSPEPPDDLEPGDLWPGPRVGIAYKLTVDDDIAYTVIEGNIERTIPLSRAAPGSAATLVKRLRRHKPGAGRIYINECRALFAPVEQDGEWVSIFLGQLGDDDPWFPEPPT